QHVGEDGIADMNGGDVLGSERAHLVSGNDALGLGADVDQDGLPVDLHHRAFYDVAPTEAARGLLAEEEFRHTGGFVGLVAVGRAGLVKGSCNQGQAPWGFVRPWGERSLSRAPGGPPDFSDFSTRGV